MDAGSVVLRLVAPEKRLSRYIQNYWIFHSWGAAIDSMEQRYLHPDGGSGVSFNLGGSVFHREILSSHRIFADYARLEPSHIGFQSTVRMVGVRFLPGGGFPFFGGEGADIAAAKDIQVLYERISEAQTFHEMVSTFDAWFLKRYDQSRISELVFDGVEVLEKTNGMASIASLSQRIGVTTRHLERLFRERVGFSPKQLGKIFRVRAARSALSKHQGISLSDISYHLGYADQAHFSREFRSIVGISPGVYRRKKSRRIQKRIRISSPGAKVFHAGSSGALNESAYSEA